MPADPVTLSLETIEGNARPAEGPDWLAGGRWLAGKEVGDGVSCTFPAGTLVGRPFLWADLMLDGNTTVVFELALQAGADGPRFQMIFALLNRCQARMVIPLDALRQNRWMWPRRGAFLKPLAYGDVVDPAEVDRMTLTMHRKAAGEYRWCMTDVIAQPDEPAVPEPPLLPDGPLLDDLGQFTLRDWPGKTRSAEEMVDRLKAQLAEADDARWPEPMGRYGGDTRRSFEATGYFRTQRTDGRWWLVDPEGHPFFSAGCNCVRSNVSANISHLTAALGWKPEPGGEFDEALSGDRRGEFLNSLGANFIRAFGAGTWKKAWDRITVGWLRRFGYNTVANWSDWKMASAAGIPYVRPMSLSLDHTAKVFRDFPDVWAPEFETDAAAFAEQLKPTVDDPALIGYFLMNEPKWGFSHLPPAEGMLRNAPVCATRARLSLWLREKYGEDPGLARAWNTEISLDDVSTAPFRGPLGDRARADLEAFSEEMVDRLFAVFTDACRKVDPHHLNLGARYYVVPPKWALKGMKRFDVFSMNCYQARPPADEIAPVCTTLGMPAMLGEWHFGALDVGLPTTGIMAVGSQADRGRAFRVYMEHAAAEPWCVGAHYFTLYDQSALGRFDGENYNIGMLDVCNRPYEPLAQAARATHERLYDVAAGTADPCDDAPEYLPRLFV